MFSYQTHFKDSVAILGDTFLCWCKSITGNSKIVIGMPENKWNEKNNYQIYNLLDTTVNMKWNQRKSEHEQMVCVSIVGIEMAK